MVPEPLGAIRETVAAADGAAIRLDAAIVGAGAGILGALGIVFSPPVMRTLTGESPAVFDLVSGALLLLAAAGAILVAWLLLARRRNRLVMDREAVTVVPTVGRPVTIGYDDIASVHVTRTVRFSGAMTAGVLASLLIGLVLAVVVYFAVMWGVAKTPTRYPPARLAVTTRDGRTRRFHVGRLDPVALATVPDALRAHGIRVHDPQADALVS